MFNPEMPQALPQEEMKPASPDKSLSARADETEPVSKAEEKLESIVDFAKRPENMLPRAGDTLPEGGMESLALQWADQMDAMRQAEAREDFQQTVASQRAMIREELLRDEIMNGGTEKKEGEGPVSSQDQVATRKSGASEWILEKLDHVPGGKKFLGALALIAGLSAIPKDADAGSSFWKNLTENTVSQGVQDYRNRQVQEQYKREQAQRQREMEDQQSRMQMEQIKERYAQESQQIVDRYDQEDSMVERNYDNQQQQLLLNLSNVNGGKQDEGLRKRMIDRVDISYHKEKLKAAERAWNGVSRVKEKYIQISTTGVSYQSQVNEVFLRNLQKVAAKEIKDLQKLGVEAVTIVPSIESASPTPVEASQPQGNAEQTALTGVKAESGSQSKSKSSEVDYSLLSR